LAAIRREKENTNKRRAARFVSAKVLVFIGVVLLIGALVFALGGRRTVVGAPVTIGAALLALAAGRSQRFKSSAFTIWVLAFGICALFYPRLFMAWGPLQLRDAIGPLVQLILFGMGMTLTFDDFARVFKMPKGVFVGFALQYAVMPFMGLTFATLFGLKPEVAAGLVLIGSCPGGVASNVITYIAGANVALSVTMTACSTLLSPLITPFAMKLLAGQYVPIDVWAMMKKILWLIIVPLIVGLLINRYAHKLARKLVRVLPVLAMLSICIIIAITIALSREDLLVMGLALFGASVCHNAAGFTFGYWGARAAGLDRRDSRTVAIEVGMQNGGMATGLAFNVLDSAKAAMASAVFGPWSAVAGSALASYWRRGRQSKPAGAPAQATAERT